MKKRIALLGIQLAVLLFVVGAANAQGGAKGNNGSARGSVLTAVEQQAANTEANAFNLADVTNTSTVDDMGGEVPTATGALPLTAADEAEMRKHAREVKKVRLNKIGFARVNEERAKKNLKPLVAGRDLDVAPVDGDMELSAPGGGTPAATDGIDTAPAAGEPAALPSYVNNSTLKYFPPIGNQGQVNSCAQWAGVYYNMTHEVAMVRDWDAKSGGDGYRMAPMFTYNFLNGGGNNGTHSYSAFNIAAVHGVVRKSEFNTSSYTAWSINSAYYRSALADRVAGYSTISSVNTASGLSNLKAHLANGHVAVYYTYINSWQYKTTSNDPSTTADDAFVGKSIVWNVSGTSGYHAMTVVGYNDDIWCDLDADGVVDANEKGAVRIANSWGTGSGEGGYFWVAYQGLVNGVFNPTYVWVLNTLPAVHVPKVVAKVTLNHNLRNQVYVQVGTGSAGSTSPSSTVTPQILTYQGGGLAFSGAAATSQDFTYYLDFTDIAPSLGTAKRWFVKGTDSGADNGNLTIKNFELYYTGAGVDQFVGVAANTPVVANGNTQYAWIDWTMGDVKPIVTWTTASQASVNESGTLTVTAQLSSAHTQAVTVPFAVTGTATTADRTISASPITIAAGATTGTATITITPDTIHELNNETVILTMGTPINAILGAATVHTATITDDDNTAPTVNAGPDQTVALSNVSVTLGWNYAPWTSDADSGISSGYSYTAKHSFGNNRTSTTVNGVTFTEGNVTSGTGWSIGGTAAFWDGNDDAVVSGNSELLAQEFVYNANPRTVTFSGLTVGKTYEAVLYSVAWETGSRSQVFSTPGVTSSSINQDQYGDNKGIRIACVYTASATTQTLTITPETASTFHLYALANREVSLTVATVSLDGTVSDSNGDTLTTTWSVVSGPAAGTIGNASAVDTTAVFSAAGTYTFRLTANDGYGPVTDDVVITVTSGGSSPSVAWTTASQSSVSESGTMTVTAQLSAASGQSVSVPFTITGTATSGSDFTVTASPMVIAAGATTGTATITITADTLDEPNETVILTMGTPINAILGATTVHTATITDDDVNTPPVVNAGPDQTAVLNGSVPTPWTPTNITTAAWYDAADASTVLANTTSVTNWLDKSGNNLTLRQTSTSLQPVTGATINGLNAIDFTGDSMTTASNPFGATINNAMVITVHKVDTVMAGGLFSLTGNAGTTRWNSHAPWSDGQLYFDCGGATAPNRISASYGVSAGSIVLTSFYCSTTDNVQQVYKNGSLLVGDSSGHSVNTVGNINVGSDAVQYQDTTIGEFIIINGTVDATTRQKIEGYLAHKWGMTNSLPADHPYKSAAPTAGSVPTATSTLAGTASDPDNDPLTTTWSVVSTTPAGLAAPTFGNAAVTNTTATFTQLGQYTLRLTANDGSAQVYDDVVITVNNGSSNTAPVANAQSVTTAEDTAKAITLIGSDVDGNPLTYAIVAQPTHGTLSGTAPSVTYTPEASYNGADSFTFKVNDGTVDSPVATVSITVTAVNGAPVVNAGTNQTVVFTNQPSVLGWTYAPWTGDADSGISNAYIYTAKHSFGNNRTSATVNGVTFTEGNVASGTGWSIGGSASYWNGNDDAAVSGNSELLAQEFVYNGKPRTVTFSGLTVGKSYEAVLYSAAWEDGSRSQTFSTPGVTSSIINQDQYGNNKGIRIACVYTATASTQTLTITPQTASTFHLYAIANREVSPAVATVSLSGSASDPDNDPLTTTWSVVSTTPAGLAAPTFGNAAVTNTTATFTQAGAYTLRLTANDGIAQSYDDVVVTVNNGTPSGTASNVTETPAANDSGADSFTSKVSDGAVDSVVDSLPSPWVSQDIGTVGLAGSVTYSNETFTVKGAGTGIGGRADALQFIYQVATADCDIQVRVASLVNAGSAGKAGVMIRETLAANAREAGIWVTPANITFTYRATTGGKTTVKTATGTEPSWVRLIRTGKTFAAYYSADGTTWTQVGTSVNITMVNNVYMGMGVNNGATGTLATGTMDNVTAAP